MSVIGAWLRGKWGHTEETQLVSQTGYSNTAGMGSKFGIICGGKLLGREEVQIPPPQGEKFAGLLMLAYLVGKVGCIHFCVARSFPLNHSKILLLSENELLGASFYWWVLPLADWSAPRGQGLVVRDHASIRGSGNSTVWSTASSFTSFTSFCLSTLPRTTS